MRIPLLQPSLLKVGSPAPDFHLINQDGRTVVLSRLLGQGPVVLGFFADDRLRADQEFMTYFETLAPQWSNEGCQAVLASSRDWEALHALHQAKQWPFDLLFDVAAKTSAKYGAMLIPRFVSGRAIFLIDSNGTIRWAGRHGLDAQRCRAALCLES